MLCKTWLKWLWEKRNTLLLIIVFILLAYVWYLIRKESVARDQLITERSKVFQTQWLPSISATRALDRLKALHDRRRMTAIARAMVDSGWDQCPSSPAMDMREDGKTCEVYFTLPEGIDEESVYVTASEGVLTMTMKDNNSGKVVYLQRIRILYGVERYDTLQMVVSNDVLRVRICPIDGVR